MAQQTQEANAVEMLKKDHQTVKELFQKFDQADTNERQTIATQIFNALDIHATLEEEIFYPAVRERVDFNEVLEEEDVEDEEDSIESDDESDEEISEDDTEVLDETDTDDTEDIIAVSYQEHQIVKDLIQQLKEMDARGPEYEQQFNELKEAVMDHVSEEEELIFPAARMKLDLNALGEQMQQRRIALAASMAA